MRLLVFGQSGQVAHELQRALPDGWIASFLSREDADLADPAACAASIEAEHPDAVINAAAYTAVDKAESEPELAHTVNGSAPGAMARACAALEIPFLHVSTDYVFPGTGNAPHSPGTQTAPCSIYGASKLAGEQAIAAAGGQWLVLRTSWVFSAHGSNFVRTMLRLGAEREALNVVADQVGGPTPARAIAEALLTCLGAMHEGHPGGVYHFAGAPDTSWAGFARAIMKEADLDCRVDDIPTSDYPTPARRPANSRLDCTATERDFGIARPDWRAALADVITELTQ